METLVKAVEIVMKYSTVFLIFFAVVNLIAFLLFALDKSSAKRKAWRIPEKHLIGVALVGGSLGAFFGMIFLRHKTKHTKFIVLLPMILVLHTIILLAAVILARL